MDLDLAGKRVLVTGGTKGLGRAIVHGFLSESAQACFCARSGTEAMQAKLRKEFSETRVWGDDVDVRDAEALRMWIERCAERMGGIDILIPNVSAMANETTNEAWTAAFDIDILGTVHTVDNALPWLEKSGSGAIVLMSSISGQEWFGGVRPYSVVKTALVGYASNLAHAHAKKGIRTNVVSPGPIYVEDGEWGKRRRERPDLYEGVVKRAPLGRMGLPEEVANAVVFLASPAAGYISGTNVLIDGAMSRRFQL